MAPDQGLRAPRQESWDSKSVASAARQRPQWPVLDCGQFERIDRGLVIALTQTLRNARHAAWLGALVPACCGAAGSAEPRHALAMHGEPALPAGFSAFSYVNPTAPKGGRLTEGIIGTFDSLNPFIVKGLAVQRMRGYVI